MTTNHTHQPRTDQSHFKELDQLEKDVLKFIKLHPRWSQESIANELGQTDSVQKAISHLWQDGYCEMSSSTFQITAREA